MVQHAKALKDAADIKLLTIPENTLDEMSLLIVKLKKEEILKELQRKHDIVVKDIEPDQPDHSEHQHLSSQLNENIEDRQESKNNDCEDGEYCQDDIEFRDCQDGEEDEGSYSEVTYLLEASEDSDEYSL